jgi:hypothetical protein
VNVIVNRGATDVSKLKIGAIEDDKPVTMTIKLPSAISHDLGVCAPLAAKSICLAIWPAGRCDPVQAWFLVSVLQRLACSFSRAADKFAAEDIKGDAVPQLAA